MNIAHLVASTFYGGPERQVLGLVKALGNETKSQVLSFWEGGRCQQFLTALRQQGIEAAAIQNDTPSFRATIFELTGLLKKAQADLVLCNGYKPNILGRLAARQCGIPAIAVSRGWTGENFRVRIYEQLDRLHLRFMDHVVAVSNAQATKVQKNGVRSHNITVIPNAVDPERFLESDPEVRCRLESMFRGRPQRIIGAAGRLSPEKGFEVLVNAAAKVIDAQPNIGFVIFGEGNCKEALQNQIALLGLTGAVVLGGFRHDLDRCVPQLDLVVLPSYTEGLPNIVLESCAAGIPVVATNVGGTPEVIEHGTNGWLVRPGDPEGLAATILEALECDDTRMEMGFQARQTALERYTFQSQGESYSQLFRQLLPAPMWRRTQKQREQVCER